VAAGWPPEVSCEAVAPFSVFFSSPAQAASPKQAKTAIVFIMVGQEYPPDYGRATAEAWSFDRTYIAIYACFK
jgi:hypothetical protein